MTPLIVQTGAAGLLWRRLRASGLGGPAVEGLRHSYRQQAIDAALVAGATARAVAALEAAGVRPMLLKGWAVARLYPERGLRPVGDVDLAVEPADAEAARRVLGRIGASTVDLHVGLPLLSDRDRAAVRGRRQRIVVGGGEVDALGDEDHLRLLALHLLAHGAARAMWLCDLGLLVERLGRSLDWDYLLAGDATRSDGVACALLLARALFGARLEGAPSALSRSLPRWLSASVLEQWGRPFVALDDLGPLPRRPAALLAEARLRWPTPVVATFTTGAPWDDRPRLPYQLADVGTRAARYLRARITAARRGR